MPICSHRELVSHRASLDFEPVLGPGGRERLAGGTQKAEREKSPPSGTRVGLSGLVSRAALDGVSEADQRRPSELTSGLCYSAKNYNSDASPVCSKLNTSSTE